MKAIIFFFSFFLIWHLSLHNSYAYTQLPKDNDLAEIQKKFNRYKSLHFHKFLQKYVQDLNHHKTNISEYINKKMVFASKKDKDFYLSLIKKNNITEFPTFFYDNKKTIYLKFGEKSGQQTLTHTLTLVDLNKGQFLFNNILLDRGKFQSGKEFYKKSYKLLVKAYENNKVSFQLIKNAYACEVLCFVGITAAAMALEGAFSYYKYRSEQNFLKSPEMKKLIAEIVAKYNTCEQKLNSLNTSLDHSKTTLETLKKRISYLKEVARLALEKEQYSKESMKTLQDDRIDCDKTIYEHLCHPLNALSSCKQSLHVVASNLTVNEKQRFRKKQEEDGILILDIDPKALDKDQKRPATVEK